MLFCSLRDEIFDSRVRVQRKIDSRCGPFGFDYTSPTFAAMSFRRVSVVPFLDALPDRNWTLLHYEGDTGVALRHVGVLVNPGRTLGILDCKRAPAEASALPDWSN
jgi:hypothetical protein